MEDKRVWRASVVLPKETEEAVIRLRQREEFARASLSEIIRTLIELGLKESGYSTADHHESA